MPLHAQGRLRAPQARRVRARIPRTSASPSTRRSVAAPGPRERVVEELLAAVLAFPAELAERSRSVLADVRQRRRVRVQRDRRDSRAVADRVDVAGFTRLDAAGDELSL